MKPIRSTAEILAFRMLERPVDKRWTDWAYEMLCAGFETENLVMLAGETEPYNQFEVQRLADKVFAKFGLTWDDRELVYLNYTRYLMTQAISGERRIIDVLTIFKNIYVDEDELSVSDFAMLYWAQDDFNYWPDANHHNIHQLTKNYFVEWLEKNKGVD